MAEFTAFHKDTVSQLPGAPIIAVNYAILRAAIRLCEDSLCLQYVCDPITVRENVADYELPIVDEETVLAKVMRVVIDGHRIPAVAPDLRSTRLWPLETYDELLVEGASTLRLIGPPGGRGTMIVRIAVKPREDAATLPDELFDDHRDAVCTGAMASMMLQPGKAWSNPQIGLLREQQFKAAINAAQIDANRGETRAETRVRPRKFA